MNLNEIFEKLEEVAPVAISNEFCKKYNLYDNSGVIIDCKQPITGALFSLDLSKQAIAKAKELNYNLIVTHHPAIYGGISKISADDNIGSCLIDGISVISMHINFDVAINGIDYHLMKGLGGENAQVHLDVFGCGYGRAYFVNAIKLCDLEKQVCNNFNTARALVYGDMQKVIKKIASFCGAGCDNRAIAFARECGADAFVSSDMKHHEIAALLQMGISVIHLTHYSAENYGFNKIYMQIKSALQIPTAYYADENLL